MRQETLPILAFASFLAANCGPSQHQAGTIVATPPEAALLLIYDGAPFEGSPMLNVVLVGTDGTKHPLQLRPESYGAFQDCTKCPADKPIVGYSPMIGGPPPMLFQPGPIGRYEGTMTRDVIADCPAGGNCIKKEPIPPGEYSLQLGNLLSCPGTVKIPLVGETVRHCTRP